MVRGLDDAEVAGYRVCVRPMPADGQSIVGWLPGSGGVYMAVTHSGVTLGAHLARLIAAEVTSGAPAASSHRTGPAVSRPPPAGCRAERPPVYGGNESGVRGMAASRRRCPSCTGTDGRAGRKSSRTAARPDRGMGC